MEIRGILLITITIITPISYPRIRTFCSTVTVVNIPRPSTASRTYIGSLVSLRSPSLRLTKQISFLPSFLPYGSSPPPPVGRANFFLSNHRGLLPYHSPVSLIQGDSAPRESQPPPISSSKRRSRRGNERARWPSERGAWRRQ